jgi:hypothetical protein
VSKTVYMAWTTNFWLGNLLHLSEILNINVTPLGVFDTNLFQLIVIGVSV